MIHPKPNLETLFVVIFLIFLLSPHAHSYSYQTLSDGPSEEWNKNWSYKQEIQPIIKTSSEQAKYQPIDMYIEFREPCWGINETTHSVRVCCWNGTNWHELDSQLYNIVFSEKQVIRSCNIVFLIPSYANGNEQYYIYYDESETPSPQYHDHVHIHDAYYYYEPITGISVEGDYYEIIDDDEIVYGIGQKGKVMNRRLSQIAIRMKPGTTTFDILNSDLLTSFSFSYQNGPDDEDEIASDFTLLGKEVTIDGNLMTEFIIISQSEHGEIISSNIYRYYHNPTDDKRITVHVHHEITTDLQVKGMINNDGRFGGIISYYSKSDSMKKMRFGNILPYLHVYNEQDRVNEYRLIDNPEGSQREWVITYNDDCDLGSAAWFSYDEGTTGKTHGIIFSKNNDIVTNASGERDGISVKVTEKEYLDIVGAEIDYASIAFGRNSYEPLSDHDLKIDKGLQIEFDVEFITLQEGTYEDIHQESIYFQDLVSYRDVSTNESLGEQYIYTLTVIPHLSGKIGSYPFLVNLTNISAPVLFGELYRDNSLEATAAAQKPLLGFELLKFPKLRSGDYIVKLYRGFKNQSRFIGIGHCNLSKDTTLHVYCTWQKTISIDMIDQYDQPIPNITIQLLKGPLIVHESETEFNMHRIHMPFPLFDSYERTDFRNISIQDMFHLSPPYFMRAWYKGFKIYNETLTYFQREVKHTIPLYDIIVVITDELNKQPGVNVNAFLSSKDMKIPFEIHPDKRVKDQYYFSDLPSATYEIHISYGGYTKTKIIDVPSSGEQVNMRFSYLTQVSIHLLTIRGERFEDETLRVELKRLGSVIYKDINTVDSIQVPPGKYTINVYDEDTLIGSQLSQVSHDTVVSVVTTRYSFIQLVFVISSFTLLGLSFFLFVSNRISLNICLKMIVLGLVFFSLVQPWWSFSGEHESESIKKTSDMYLFPQIMIEEYQENGTRELDIATIPEIFLNFLFYLTIIIGIGMVLMFASFIPNILLKRRFAFLLAVLSILFVLIVTISFYLGMSSITEISLGSLQGTDVIDVTVPSGETVTMNATWGLGIGFYTILFAFLISLTTGIVDIFRSRHKWMKQIKQMTQTKK